MRWCLSLAPHRCGGVVLHEGSSASDAGNVDPPATGDWVKTQLSVMKSVP